MPFAFDSLLGLLESLETAAQESAEAAQNEREHGRADAARVWEQAEVEIMRCVRNIEDVAQQRNCSFMLNDNT